MEYGDARLTEDDLEFFDLCDCIRDELTAQFTEYPLLLWGTIHICKDDPDLLFMVPLVECDPYGRLLGTFPYGNNPGRMKYSQYAKMLKENLHEPLFIEDTEEQDHLLAYMGNGAWVHRTDLLGLDRNYCRPQIVEPCQRYLHDMCATLEGDEV